MKSEVIIVAGMAWGDEGKGSIVDFLTRRHDAKLVVRYNGGPQAAHNVVCTDGRHHSFAQFGSGTFVPGVRTHLSRYMLVNPISMMIEEKQLRERGIDDAFDRMTVEKACIVVTPFHRALNRLQEWSRWASGEVMHGSCGAGVGVARDFHIQFGEKVVFAEDLKRPYSTGMKLDFIQSKALEFARRLSLPNNDSVDEQMAWLTDRSTINWCVEQYREWNRVETVAWTRLGELIGTSGTTIFEGAQGVLLDETHGISPPHVTWTDTTFSNAEYALAALGFSGGVRKIGVLRSYFTRHGAGPFPTELQYDVLDPRFSELHNGTETFQGRFRVGAFDLRLARYAIELCQPDELAINHLDVEEMGDETRHSLGVPITIEGRGPWSSSKSCAEIGETKTGGLRCIT